MENLTPDDASVLAEPDGMNLAKLAIQYADGIIAGVPKIDPGLEAFARERNLPILPYTPISKEGGEYVRLYNGFYDDLLKDR